MRQDKPKAFELRKSGKTYREIEELLNISRSTLCNWFKNEQWSKHIKKSNINRHLELSTERLKKLHEARRLILDKEYLKAETDAIQEFEFNKNDPLFMAGLMIYAGEGDKTNRFRIKLTNSEFYLHLIFIKFLEKFLKIERKNIKFWLLLYPDHDIEKSVGIWSYKLNISKSNFNKSQVIAGKEKIRKLQYGVGNSIISSVILKKKLLKWLEICRENFK
jgi:transcriptional regulator with XRE-family HTH domain